MTLDSQLRGEKNGKLTEHIGCGRSWLRRHGDRALVSLAAPEPFSVPDWSVSRGRKLIVHMSRRLHHSPHELSSGNVHKITRNNVSLERAVRISISDTPAPGIVVVAVNRLFCEALAATVEQRFTVLGTGSTLSEAEQMLERHQPQLSLLIVDPPFPNSNFADMCQELVGRYPMTHALLVFQDRRPENFVRAYQQGAQGLFDITVSVDQLINGLERLASGEVVIQPEILREMMQARARANAADRRHQLLTAAQTRMLALLSKGYTTKEIARLMQSTSASVNHHIERASQQLGARHRTEAVARALRLGIIA